MQESTQAALGICHGKRKRWEYLSSKFQHSCQRKMLFFGPLTFLLLTHIWLYVCFEFQIYVLNCPPPAGSESGLMGLWPEWGLGLQLQKQILQLHYFEFLIYFSCHNSELEVPTSYTSYSVTQSYFQLLYLWGLLACPKSASWLFLKHHRGTNHREARTYICISPSAHVTRPHFICSKFHVTSSQFHISIHRFGRNQNKVLYWCINLPLISELHRRPNVIFCSPSPATIPLHLPKYNILETWVSAGWLEIREGHYMASWNYLYIWKGVCANVFVSQHFSIAALVCQKVHGFPKLILKSKLGNPQGKDMGEVMLLV